MAMACDGRADLGRIAIAVAGASPRVFILDISATNEIISVPLAPSIFNMDGCCDIAMCPDDKVDMLAMSGLSGSVDVYKLSSLEHLENVPHREKVVKYLKFILKPSNSQDGNEILLLCVSESNLSLWNISECENNPADCENVYDACLLDLPFVYNVLKADRLCIRRKTVLKRTPRLNQEAGDTVDTLSTQLQSLTLTTTKENKRRRCTKSYRLNKSLINQAKHKTEAEARSTSLNTRNEQHYVNCDDHLPKRIHKLAVWMNGMKGTERKNEIIERWDRLRSSSNTDNKPDDISKLLNIDKEMVDKFSLFRDFDIVVNVRSTNYSCSVYPGKAKP